MMCIRIALVAPLFLLALVAEVRAQGDPLIQQVVLGTQSTELSVRRKALDALTQVVATGNQRQLLGNGQLQDALLGLLRRENATIVSLYQDGRGVAGVYGEGYGEYYSQILDLAVKITPLLETARQREWLKELARGSYNPDSKFAEWVGGYGDLVVDSLLDQAHAAEIEPDRNNAYAVLAQMVAFTALLPGRSQPYPHPLSLTNRQRALSAINEGLDRQDGGVTREVVWALRRTPSGEALMLLQRFLQRARGRPGFASRVDGPRSLQEEVEKAIAEMQVALGQKPR